MDERENLEQIGRAMMLAWGRIKKAQARMWGDWMTIGEGLLEGRRWAMQRAGINRPEGKGYVMAFGEWLKRYKVDDMDKSDRAKLLQLMEERPSVEEWRATLTDYERRNLNNPTIAWRKWTTATRKPKDDDAANLAKIGRIRPEPSGIDWNPQDEAEMRKALSEAHVENQKLAAEAADARARMGTMAMIDVSENPETSAADDSTYVTALQNESEELRTENATLKAKLAACGYAEPFPNVGSGGVGTDDVESNKIVAWFENRIVEGRLGPWLVQLAAHNLDSLTQAYWGNNGKPSACKRLTSERKAAVIAERKNKTPRPPLTPDQKLERLMAEKRKSLWKLAWTGDDKNGWFADSYSVMRTNFRGSDHFEVRLNDQPLLNRNGGLRRTLDPVPTVAKAKAQAEADYAARGNAPSGSSR